jgi:hypothetical protein
MATASEASTVVSNPRSASTLLIVRAISAGAPHLDAADTSTLGA